MGLYFAAKGFAEENAKIFAIWCFFPTSYFSSERDPGAVKMVSHILRSLFYKKNLSKL